MLFIYFVCFNLDIFLQIVLLLLTMNLQICFPYLSTYILDRTLYLSSVWWSYLQWFSPSLPLSLSPSLLPPSFLTPSFLLPSSFLPPSFLSPSLPPFYLPPFLLPLLLAFNIHYISLFSSSFPYFSLFCPTPLFQSYTDNLSAVVLENNNDDDNNITSYSSGSQKKSEIETDRLKSQITPLGFHLAALPINPRIGKLILFGKYCTFCFNSD